MKKYIIYGANTSGAIVYKILENRNCKVLAFIDRQGKSMSKSIPNSLKVFTKLEEVPTDMIRNTDAIMIAVGNEISALKIKNMLIETVEDIRIELVYDSIYIEDYKRMKYGNFFENKIVKKFVDNIEIKSEEKAFIKLLENLKLENSKKVLDVGCGYGRYLRILHDKNINYMGIDSNKSIVDFNKKLGLNCMTVEEFQECNEKYDLIIMSHIIEHFMPKDLIKFMDFYLDRLKVGGYLIIATPLYWNGFYDDFDHIKPYHPTGISMFFGGSDSQVQYYSRNKLRMLDIWFRRAPFRVHFYKGLYVSKYSNLPQMLNCFFSIIYSLSFGFIGYSNGWIGLYEKIDN